MVDEVGWTPEVDATHIEVAVDDGIVTLRGHVDSLSERVAAEQAAFRVRGVTAVRDELVVQPDPDRFSDEGVGAAVTHALAWRAAVPRDITASVADGVAVLTGEAQWEFQRLAAQHTAESVSGVRRVDNRITLARRPTAEDTEERIRNALVRDAVLESQAIRVEIRGTQVILRGTVRSWTEKARAARTAWSSPHVTAVDNRIIVRAD